MKKPNPPQIDDNPQLRRLTQRNACRNAKALHDDADYDHDHSPLTKEEDSEANAHLPTTVQQNITAIKKLDEVYRLMPARSRPQRIARRKVGLKLEAMRRHNVKLQ